MCISHTQTVDMQYDKQTNKFVRTRSKQRLTSANLSVQLCCELLEVVLNDVVFITCI